MNGEVNGDVKNFNSTRIVLSTNTENYTTKQVSIVNYFVYVYLTCIIIILCTHPSSHFILFCCFLFITKSYYYYIVNDIISANRGQPITTKKLHRRSKQSDTRRRRRNNIIVKEDLPAAMDNEDIADNVIITGQLDIVESVENVVVVDSSSNSVDDMAVTQNMGDGSIELLGDGGGAPQWVGGVPITNNLKFPIIIPRALVDLYGLDGNGDVFNDEGVVCQDVVSDVIAWDVGDTINVEGVCQDEGRDIIESQEYERGVWHDTPDDTVKPGLVSRYSYGMSHLCQCIYSSACLFLSLYNF